MGTKKVGVADTAPADGLTLEFGDVSTPLSRATTRGGGTPLRAQAASGGTARKGKVRWKKTSALAIPAVPGPADMQELAMQMLAESTHSNRKKQDANEGHNAIGDGFLSWQIPIAVVLTLFAMANSLGVLIDSEQGQLSCKTVNGQQECNRVTYDSIRAQNCSSLYDCATAIESAHTAYVGANRIGHSVGLANGEAVGRRQLRRLAWAPQHEQGGGSRRALGLRTELEGVLPLVEEGPACEKLVGSLACDFDLQTLRTDLPNRTLVSTLCPVRCCKALRIAEPVGVNVCPPDASKPRTIPNTCNASALERSWIATVLASLLMTETRASVDSRTNWTCGGALVLEGRSLDSGLRAGALGDNQTTLLRGGGRHALNAVWCTSAGWPAAAGGSFGGHPCGAGFAQLEPQLKAQCRTHIRLTTGQALEGLALDQAIAAGDCGEAPINFTSLAGGCATYNNFPEQPTTITLPVVGLGAKHSFKERLVHTFIQLSAHCTTPNVSATKSNCAGSNSMATANSVVNILDKLASVAGQSVKPICVNSISPEEVREGAWMTMIGQGFVVFILLLGTSTAACTNSFNLNRNNGESEHAGACRSATEALALFLAWTVTSYCLGKHWMLQQSAQHLVENNNADLLFQEGKGHLADFDPLTMGAYFWNCQIQELVVFVLLFAVLWNTYFGQLCCGHERSANSERVMADRARQMKTVLVCMAYLMVGAFLFRSFYPADFHTFAQAFYFVLVTCTTIGYGDMSSVQRSATGESPTTSVWILIVYALFGIAMLGELIGVIGELMLDGLVQYEVHLIRKPCQILGKLCCSGRARHFLERIERKHKKDELQAKISTKQQALTAGPNVDHTFQLWNELKVMKTELAAIEKPGDDLAEAKLRSWMALGLMIICLLVIGPYMAQLKHCWSYHEAVYYTFVTMSTIGFGDYYPGNDKVLGHLAVEKTRCDERIFGWWSKIQSDEYPITTQRVNENRVAIWLLAVDFILLLLAMFSLLLRCRQDASAEKANAAKHDKIMEVKRPDEHE